MIAGQWLGGTYMSGPSTLQWGTWDTYTQTNHVITMRNTLLLPWLTNGMIYNAWSFMTKVGILQYSPFLRWRQISNETKQTTTHRVKRWTCWPFQPVGSVNPWLECPSWPVIDRETTRKGRWVTIMAVEEQQPMLVKNMDRENWVEARWSFVIRDIV